MLRRIVSNFYRRLPVVRELKAVVREHHKITVSLLHVENYVSRVENYLRASLVSQTIRLLDFDLRDHPRYGDPRRLLRYYSQVCSQNGEDGIIHEIFRRIGTTTKIFVEVGVGDGCENNTAFLLSQGWTGFWINGDSGFLGALENRADLQEDCLKYLVAFASKENISALFEQLGVPKEFDLLSLDIDQNTYYAWEGLRSFRPRVVVVEYNAAIPPDVDWKVRYGSKRTWNGTQNFGASLKAFEILGRQFGYSLVGCEFLGVNAFFVRDDLLEGKFAEPFTSENHYEPPRYSMWHRRCHPPSILDRTGHGYQSKMNEMEAQFEEIYFKNKWLYGSGEGSLPEHTRDYVSVLQRFLREHVITTVVDMGCGDWQFSKLIDWSGITYDGFDIVRSVIGENQKRFSSKTVKFHLYSGNPGELPAADLLIAKDVLQHLSDAAVKAFLPELKRYKYAIITNCVNPHGATVNADIEDGAFRYLDLRLPPFSIEAEELFSFTNQRPIFTRLFSKPRWVKKVLLVQSRTQRRDSGSMRT